MNKNIKLNKSWTLFLDRDGVINKRPINNYVKNIQQFEFIDGVLESLAQLNKIFGRIIIVTNQQGIAKGLMLDKDLTDIHFYMCQQIEKAGGRIDKIFYCPELESSCSNNRKPEIGMGLQAKKHFPEIDFTRSIMVGDTISDIVFGKNLRMYTVLITDDNDYIRMQDDKEWDMHFLSLNEFTKWVMKMHS